MKKKQDAEHAQPGQRGHDTPSVSPFLSFESPSILKEINLILDDSVKMRMASVNCHPKSQLKSLDLEVLPNCRGLALV